MASYSYSWTDFPQGEALDAERAQACAEADAGIEPACIGATVHGTAETVEFLFDAELDEDEQSALDAVVSGYVFETLAEAKARCIGECKQWLGFRFEAPKDQGGLAVEYPEASGKHWSLSFVDQQYWAKLSQVRNAAPIPLKMRTWNELDEYEFGSAQEIQTFFEDHVTPLVLGKFIAMNDAIAAILLAGNIPDAEAARDTFVGVE
jgi:hypothetical protein